MLVARQQYSYSPGKPRIVPFSRIEGQAEARRYCTANADTEKSTRRLGSHMGSHSAHNDREKQSNQAQVKNTRVGAPG